MKYETSELINLKQLHLHYTFAKLSASGMRLWYTSGTKAQVM